MENNTKRLIEGLSAIATELNIAHSVAQVGSMFTFFFNPERVTSFQVSKKNDTERFSKYFHGMLDRGFYLPCSQFEANFVGIQHTEEDGDTYQVLLKQYQQNPALIDFLLTSQPTQPLAP